jgi:selenocysteine lyase/cysteine desulfurase
MLTDETRQRDFPSLSDRVYLNSAAEGIPPPAVREALAAYFADKELGMDGRLRHQAQWQAARVLVGEMYGLSADEIGICSCASEAFTLASLALRLQPGDEVVVNDLDFPAGVSRWVQPDSPATVRVWRHREGVLHIDDLVPLLSPRTRLVTTSLVSFYNGFLLPLPPLVEAVRRHSAAKLIVDVTQALGRIPLDLRGVDLIVSSTHKWILASHGGGLVGVPREQAEAWTVPAAGWFHLQDPFGADRFTTAAPKPGAAGFMIGMPNYPAIYAIRAALDYIRGVGVERIDAATRPLVQHCHEELAKLPLKLITPGNPETQAGIVAFTHPDASRLHRALQERRIHVMCQAGRMRIALHGYNTFRDVETLVSALRDELGRIGRSTTWSATR